MDKILDNQTIFFHFRYKHGKICLERDVKHVDTKGGITIAVRKENNVMYYGYSCCSALDIFEKRRGRIRSEGISRSKKAIVSNDLSIDIIKKNVVDIANILSKCYSVQHAVYTINQLLSKNILLSTLV